jgi:hypothetical protein
MLVGMHSLATPLFEAPDEVWHYAYVRWVAEGHGLPAMDDDVSGANQEVAQPPLYYGVAALLSLPFPDDDLQTLFWHNPNFGHQASGTVPDNKNMLIHTAQERWPWRGASLAVRVARLTSLLFGGLTVVAAWGLGYETFTGRQGALVTAMLVAFHPQFVFISGVVSNDSAAAALSTMTLWLTARVLRRGLNQHRVALLGVFVGLAALTKTSVVLLWPLVGLGLCVAVWRRAFRGHSDKPVTKTRVPLGLSRRFVLDVLSVLLLYSGMVLFVGGWWYARNWIHYGDPLGITSHIDTPWGRSAPKSLLGLLPELPLLLRSFWAAYGWGHVLWPDWVYGVLWVGSLCALGYAVCRILRGFTHISWGQLKDVYHLTYAGWHVLSTLTILILAMLWFVLILAALLRWMQQVAAPHGRLLFPTIGGWAVLLASGLIAKPLGGPHARAPDGYGIRNVRQIFLIFLFAVSALAPGARILATFAPPRLYKPAHVAETVNSSSLTYGDKARLLGATVKPVRVAPGDGVQVRACWEGLRPMSEAYTVFVHLIGPENMRVGERHTYPGLGRFPTSLWPVGHAFCDVYRLRVVSWAEGPMRYHVEMGLFDAQTGERLPAETSTGTPLGPPIVGVVDIVPAEEKIPSPSHPLSVTLGDRVMLRGYDVGRMDPPLPRLPQIKPGETLTVTLYWKALQAVDDDFIAFVHLWQPGATAPLAQHDARPRQGWFPTFAWEAGDWILDVHPLTVPETLAPGHYPLWAGLYRADNGGRLPAVYAEGRYPYDLVPLDVLIVDD